MFQIILGINKFICRCRKSQLMVQPGKSFTIIEPWFRDGKTFNVNINNMCFWWSEFDSISLGNGNKTCWWRTLLPDRMLWPRVNNSQRMVVGIWPVQQAYHVRQVSLISVVHSHVIGRINIRGGTITWLGGGGYMGNIREKKENGHAGIWMKNQILFCLLQYNALQK